jgi:hypothetical protein
MKSVPITIEVIINTVAMEKSTSIVSLKFPKDISSPLFKALTAIYPKAVNCVRGNKLRVNIFSFVINGLI